MDVRWIWVGCAWIPMTQPTTHTNANRQHYVTWSGEQQCYEKIKLASMPNKSTSIPPLLGGGQIKQRWICHQASRIHSSPNNTTNFSHPSNHTSKTTWQNPKSTPRSKGVLDILVPGILPLSTGSISWLQVTSHSTHSHRTTHLALTKLPLPMGIM